MHNSNFAWVSPAKIMQSIISLSPQRKQTVVTQKLSILVQRQNRDLQIVNEQGTTMIFKIC